MASEEITPAGSVLTLLRGHPEIASTDRSEDNDLDMPLERSALDIGRSRSDVMRYCVLP